MGMSKDELEEIKLKYLQERLILFFSEKLKKFGSIFKRKTLPSDEILVLSGGTGPWSPLANVLRRYEELKKDIEYFRKIGNLRKLEEFEELTIEIKRNGGFPIYECCDPKLEFAYEKYNFKYKVITETYAVLDGPDVIKIIGIQENIKTDGNSYSHKYFLDKELTHIEELKSQIIKKRVKWLMERI